MQDDQDLRAKLEAAIAQGQHLRDEVQHLKAILAHHSIPLREPKTGESASTRYLPAPSEVAQIGTIADNAQKIALFRSLFRGREDIYAERWRTKDGTWAYRPSGKKDWLAVLASRPEEYKKVDREDGHHPIIFMQCGPIRFNLSAREAAERSPFRHLVLPRPTGFRMPSEVTDLTIHEAYAALVTNEERNRQIVADILQVVRESRCPLVLTNRTDHIERLANSLSDVQHVLVLKGGMGKKQRKALAERLASIPDGTPRVLIATGSYIGEGFDDLRLDTLFLTMPISWRGTLQQYVGRLHRIHDGKKVVRVFDYVDAQVPMLARMYEKRIKGYRAIGYEIEAIAGDEKS